MAEGALNLLETFFAHGWMLSLLAVLPFLGLSGWLAARRRRRLAAAWTGGRHTLAVHPRRRLLRSLAAGMMPVLLIVGSAAPQWGRDPAAPGSVGRDLMVVLDLSRSMLAEYPPASRLGRAKTYLADLADTLQRRGGYRLGLIVFARQARVLVPLTDDYDHFRHMLEQVHPDGFGGVVRLADGLGDRPGDQPGAAEAGTRLRPALELAVSYLDPRGAGFQELLVVSDGDDLAGDWQRGVESARRAGVPIHALGVGDAHTPRRIPHGGSYLKHEDEWVTTRRHDEVLDALARGSDGVFLPEESSTLPLVFWFQTHIATLPVREWTGDPRPIAVARYGWFFAGALFLLLLEAMMGDAAHLTEDEK